MLNQEHIQHFILTRFNLLLWNKDKEGNRVRNALWLGHRSALFEQYCLPSIRNQTCQSFEWIVLFDSTTPDNYKDRIEQYIRECPQLIPIYVEPENGRYFAEIFREEVIKRWNGNRVLTTYLDNDDALNIHFVEDVQQRSKALPDGAFITYDDGLQLFTDYQYLMQIHYPRNHFMSVVESGNPLTVKTIYGYGSHYYIDKIPGANIEHVKNQPMWCEVIHERNMGNDAYFLGAKMVKDDGLLITTYCLQEKLKSGVRLYIFRFLPRYIKTFVRRIGYKLFGRHW